MTKFGGFNPFEQIEAKIIPLLSGGFTRAGTLSDVIRFGFVVLFPPFQLLVNVDERPPTYVTRPLKGLRATRIFHDAVYGSEIVVPVSAFHIKAMMSIRLHVSPFNQVF